LANDMLGGVTIAGLTLGDVNDAISAIMKPLMNAACGSIPSAHQLLEDVMYPEVMFKGARRLLTRQSQYLLIQIRSMTMSDL
jgi:hypothetical protein